MIDVTVVGGPDVAAVVERDGPVLSVRLRAGDAVPASVERAVVVLETAPVRHVDAPDLDPTAPGLSGRPTADVTGPWAATDQGCVAWLGARRAAGRVLVKADGWLVTAVADLGGLVLAPGEAVALDPLFVGPSLDGAIAAWAAAVGPCRPLPHRRATLGPADGDGTIGLGGVDDLAARAASGPAGVVIDPWPADGDLSRPEVPAALEATGAALAGAGAAWVSALGVARTLGPAIRWGGSSSTPAADLHAALVALRRGLGDGPVLHLPGAPPAVAAGAADVVDTGAAAALWAPFDGLLWHAVGAGVTVDLG